MNESEKDRLAFDLATEVMAWANACPARVVKLAGEYLQLDVIVRALRVSAKAEGRAG